MFYLERTELLSYKEMIELYQDKGFSKADSTKMVNIMSKNKEAWIEIMMVEELGIIETKESPVRNAIVTFLSFLIFGFILSFPHAIVQFTH